MNAEARTLAYGASEVPYYLERRPRRTLEINVLPDASIHVAAPEGEPLVAIEEILRKRMRWIIRQRRQFERRANQPPTRHYLSGETHQYLGKQYRLKVELGIRAGVRLRDGRLHVTSHSTLRPDRIAELLDAWYRQRAADVFRRRLGAVLHAFPDPEQVTPGGILIRRLSGRWGSMTPGGRLVLNLDLVKKPTPCIDYVITHELCHRLEHHHGQAFWNLLDRVMPDWRQRKERLERGGIL